MKSLFIIIVYLYFSTLLFSQVRLKPEVIAQANKFKKEFPKEDYISLGTKTIYNFNYGKETVESEVFYEEHIMSLKEDLMFYKNIFFNEEIEISNAYITTYRGTRKKVLLTEAKYKSDGIFYDDASIASFKFFLSTRGDNSTYYYKSFYKDVKYLTKGYFHNNYPVEEATLVFNIPDWLDLEFVEMNFDGYEITKTEAYDTKKKIKTITYSTKKLKSMKGGNYTISANRELPHLLVLSKSYTKKGKTIDLFSTTQDLYSWYASLLKEMDNKPDVFKAKVEELTADATTDMEKVESIFYWVQDNTRYIAYEDGIMGFKPANADDVYSKRYGDCKGMANLTCSMLKLAGFDARLTWIGTKSIPYTYATPSLAVDNHMITTLYLDSQTYFLDATEKGVAVGEYAYRIQGQDVLIENGDTYILDSVPEYNDDYNLRITSYDLVLLESRIFGSAKEEFHGEEQTGLFRSLQGVSKVDLFERVSKYVSNYDKNNSIGDLHISNYMDRSKPIVFEYKINMDNRITEVEKERYFSLELDRKFSSMNVEDGRNMGYDFQQKVHNKYEASLKLPDNYNVDYLPVTVNIDNEEFLVKAKYSFDESTSTIEYEREIIIKNGIIPPSKFAEWDSAINKLKEIYNDQIILIEK
ncbi:MAG: transglutaminase domain-containing protein [Bacteroidales bacterium]|nr:transglutaminase domain-containing protein [Bacteroidales bacterium]